MKQKNTKKLTKKELKKIEKREENKKFKEWSKQVRAWYDNKCVICGETKYLNAHHILPREIKEFRFEPINGIALCPKHHKWSNEISAHKNPFVFYLWLKKELPDVFDYLECEWDKFYKAIKPLN